MKVQDLLESNTLDSIFEDMGTFAPTTDANMTSEQQLEKAVLQFSAARRALGLVNKLAAGPTKQRHASRVLGVLNKIRATIRRIEKQITVDMSADIK